MGYIDDRSVSRGRLNEPGPRDRAGRPGTLADAVLVDRDGTLVLDVPYNGDPDRVVPMPAARGALDRLRAAGLRVGVLTNQSGIARGLLTRDQVDAVNARVEELLGPFDDWQVCPHDDGAGCRCRKPSPGMVHAAARNLGTSAARCVVIGDIGRDVVAAGAAGALSVLVPTGATDPAEIAAAPVVAPDLGVAADWVLGRDLGPAAGRRPGGHVLAVRADSAGDVLLTGPAIRALAAGADRLTLLCGPRGEAAAALLPGVDDLVSWHTPWIDPEPKPVDPVKVSALVDRLAAAAVDEAVIFTSYHQSPLPIALLLRLAGVLRVSGISADYPGSLLDVRHRVGGGLPEPDRALSLAAAAGFGLPEGDDGRLRVRTAEFPPPTEPGYVVVHPGASVPARACPPERVRELAGALVAAGHRVVVTGGSKERGAHPVRGRGRGGGGSGGGPGRAYRPGRAGRRPGRRVLPGLREHRTGTPGRRRRYSRGEPLRPDRPLWTVGAVPGPARTAGRPARLVPGQPGGHLPRTRAPVPVVGLRRRRRARRRPAHRALLMRILLWHVHGSWTTAFVQGGHTYLVPVNEQRDAYGLGRARTYPWPDDVVEVTAAELARTDVDVVLLQRPEELELVTRWLGRRPPTVYVEHNTPRGDVPGARHPMADRDDLTLVHVTHFNDLLWDAGATRTAVVEHGIPDPGHRYTGELPRFGVATNEPVRRGRVTGTDLLPRFAAVAPLDVYGIGVAALPGHLASRHLGRIGKAARVASRHLGRIGKAARVGLTASAVTAYEDPPQSQLHAQLSRRRAYLHLPRWTSLGLSLLEAMFLGMPVVALAVTEAVRAVPPGAGVLSTSVDELVDAARWLLDDEPAAHRLGTAARAAVRERYGLPRFLSDWDRLLKEVISCASP